jgi:hypothetical protein
MAHDQNGRGITGPGNGMRGPSWRPQDQHDMRDSDDRDQDIRGRRDVRGRDMHGRDDDYGQGQSGYGAGRVGDDRSMMEFRNRNQSDRFGRGEEQDRGFHADDRFSGGRGGEDYWLDRSDRPNPQWDHRDREHERHQRERMGYFGPRPDDRMTTGYRTERGLPPQASSVRHHGYGMEGSHRPSSPQDRFDSAGGHRGKGPMGYTRSDERIREMVCEALTDHDEVDASNIDVVVKNCEVTLSGTVDDRQQKRLAEDIAERCSGVKDVSNQLKIGSQSSSQSTSNQSNTTSTVGAGKHDKPRA